MLKYWGPIMQDRARMEQYCWIGLHLLFGILCCVNIDSDAVYSELWAVAFIVQENKLHFWYEQQNFTLPATMLMNWLHLRIVANKNIDYLEYADTITIYVLQQAMAKDMFQLNTLSS